MGLVDNLVEGLSSAAGATGAVDAFEKKKADRSAMQHQELEANTKSILDDVQNLKARRATLPPGDPGIAEIDKALTAHQQAFHDMYHPIKNPGALGKLGGFLQKHLTGKDPKPAPQSNEVTPQRMAGLEASAAGTQAPDPYLTPQQLKQKALIAAGIEPKAGTDKPDQENWVPRDVTMADGSVQTLQQNSKSGKWTDLNGNPVPPERLSGARLVPKPGSGGNSKFSQEKGVYEKQWGKPIAQWTPEELSYFNQKMAYDAQRNGQSTTTKLEKDQDNNIVPVEVTTTHGPMAAPVDPHAPKVPTSPGEAKSRVKVHAPLPFKAPSADVTAARKTWEGAVQLASLADQVEKHPDDAVTVKGFAIALERARAGRFTTQALDVMLDAGWANKLEQWANKPSSGTLPRDVLRQLIEGAHQNVKATKDALDAARGPNTTTGGAAPKPSGKAVSLAAAKKLPQNKGKSDDEIRKDIEAHGHKVIP